VKLRHAHLAVVERDKIVDYLLNPAHPDNGGKAQLGSQSRSVRTIWIVDRGLEAPRLVTAYPGKE
jgi:hypothetical protein